MKIPNPWNKTIFRKYYYHNYHMQSNDHLRQNTTSYNHSIFSWFTNSSEVIALHSIIYSKVYETEYSSKQSVNWVITVECRKGFSNTRSSL